MPDFLIQRHVLSFPVSPVITSAFIFSLWGQLTKIYYYLINLIFLDAATALTNTLQALELHSQRHPWAWVASEEFVLQMGYREGRHQVCTSCLVETHIRLTLLAARTSPHQGQSRTTGKEKEQVRARSELVKLSNLSRLLAWVNAIKKTMTRSKEEFGIILQWKFPSSLNPSGGKRKCVL